MRRGWKIETARVNSRNATLGRVTMTGYLRSSPGISFSPMRVLGSYALVYLTEGGGRYQIRGQAPRPCRAGDLLVIFPEIPHAYGPEAGGHWSEVYAIFEGEIFDLWRRLDILTPESPILRLLPVSRYARLLRNISERRGGDDPARQLDQICRLQSFLALAMAKNQRNDGGPGDRIWPDWVAAAVEQMENDRPVLLEDVARGAGLSYESFRKKFRAITGISPARYRNRLAIVRARKLIYEERLSNKELADRLGFCDEFHFSRRFRQTTGQSPGEFRRSLPKGP